MFRAVVDEAPPELTLRRGDAPRAAGAVAAKDIHGKPIVAARRLPHRAR